MDSKIVMAAAAMALLCTGCFYDSCGYDPYPQPAHVTYVEPAPVVVTPPPVLHPAPAPHHGPHAVRPRPVARPPQPPRPAVKPLPRPPAKPQPRPAVKPQPARPKQGGVRQPVRDHRR